MKKYALFDWDNTVRSGYTLYSWVDFLCSQSIIDPYLQYTLNDIKKKYLMEEITHDQYADIACSEYAKALSGLQLSKVNDALIDYMHYDRINLFNGIHLLFELLHKKGIDVIVISGAPSLVIENYKIEFHIKSIYGFKERVVNGIFTGNVEYNYGFDKKTKVLELIGEYGTYPCLAFGDSESDIPMLQYASNAFCINSALTNNNFICVESNNIADGIISVIDKLL